MTLKELHLKLKSLNIPEDQYCLHGLFGSANDDEKLSITIRKKKYNYEYEVYYKERGLRSFSRIFNSEEEATVYFYNQIRQDFNLPSLS
ncbi:MAG: hypothetical protein AAF363_00180 [Bacteroidota bacterium]